MAKQKKQSEPVYTVKPVLLYGVAFIAGFFIMVLEMLGFRLLAPYFGYSTYVWGSLIGIIMAALALGYLWGGFLADRYTIDWLGFWALLLSGFYTTGLSFTYKKILLFSQGLGLTGGSIAASMILFAVPMLMLSTVSPLAIKMLAREDKIGTTAGRIYSTSTVGSIAGTFLASFYFIPVLGSHKTMIICAVVLIMAGVAGVFLHKKKSIIILIFVGLAAWNYPEPMPGANVVYAGESPYSQVRVEALGKWLILKPGNNFIHSIYNPDHILSGNVWDYYCLAPCIQNKAQNCLVLGMGGGTSVRQYLHYWPDLQIDALDIDPLMIEVATGMFGIPKDSPRLNLIVEDARSYLAVHPEKKYDFIQVDIYRGGVDIPFYLTTLEFFTLCQEHLKPGGMIIMNVNVLKDPAAGAPTLYGCIGNTLAELFPSLYSISLNSGNSLFLSFSEEKSLKDLKQQLQNPGSIPDDLQKLALDSGLKISAYQKDDSSFIITDDKAPIDQLTYPIAVEAFKHSRK